MGKRAKGLRHLLKMKEKRAMKAAKAAQYAALAGSGNNSKRRSGNTSKKPHISIPDPSCKNIGNLIQNPDQIAGAYRVWLVGGSGGRYKTLMRERDRIQHPEWVLR